MNDLVEAVEKATAAAERYGRAIVAISEVLASDTLSDRGKVMRVRLVLVGLDSELPADEGERQ